MNAPIDISNTVLKTERLVLRPWKQSDLDDFFAYASVDGVGQMAGWVPHANKEESQEILTRFIQNKKTFALEYEGKVIGSLGIELYNEKNFPELADKKCREIGYVLAKDYWGRGLMPEAVKETIRYLFEEVGLDLILCGHFLSNKQSARVQEKCGFVHYAYGQYETRFGTIEDDETNILTKEKWLSDRKKKENAATEVLFSEQVDDRLLKYAVILARYQDQWIFCKHKERDTYEIPGGHREKGETILEAALRELEEETGATEYSLEPVCVYCVKEEEKETFGMLYYAEISELEDSLHHEIEKLLVTRDLPEKWTYPRIQPKMIEEAEKRGLVRRKMEWLNTDFLEDEEIKLVVDRLAEAVPEKNYVPAYKFFICDKEGNEMGYCDLRIGYNDNLYYGGHIGYGIKEEYRGHHYAAKACRLLFELARKHGMEYLYITCDPENLPSRKTLEYLKGELVEIATLPEDNEMRITNGDKEKCIFRFDL